MNKANNEGNSETKEIENIKVKEQTVKDGNNELMKSNTVKTLSRDNEKVKNQVNGHISIMYVLLTITMVFGFLPTLDFILSSIFIVQPNKQMFYTFIQFTIIAFGLLKALDNGLLKKNKRVVNSFNEFFFSRKGSIVDLFFIIVSVSLYFCLLHIKFFEINSIINEIIGTII